MNFASKKKTGPGRDTARVSKWVRTAAAELIEVDPKLQILATEVSCNEPGCVPIETLIILISSLKNDDMDETSKGWRWTNKILCPISDVKQEHCIALNIPKSINDINSGVPVVVDENAFTIPFTDKIEQKQKIEIQTNKIEEESSILSSITKTSEEGLPKSSSEGTLEVGVKLDSADDKETPTSEKSSTITMPISKNTKNNGGKTGAKSVFSVNGGSVAEEIGAQKHTGVRPRGCPCCDPDDLDNILDTLTFDMI